MISDTLKTSSTELSGDVPARTGSLGKLLNTSAIRGRAKLMTVDSTVRKHQVSRRT